MADRRADLTDAAISTVARLGMRGLTHRAVDRAAGVPEGSTSYYFRTRDALLQATVERLAELSTAEISQAPDLPEMAAMLRHWVTDGRERMLARFELTLESTRRPELRAVFERVGAQFRALAEDMLRAAGVADPRLRAANLIAHIDGLVFDQIVGVGPLRTEAELRDTLESLLSLAIK